MALSQIAFDFDSPANEPVAEKKPLVKEKAAAKESTVTAVAVTPPKRKSTRGRLSIREMEAGADLIEVPEDEVLFQKMYYSIGSVSDMFKVNQSLIRFWENEFDILKPRKNGKGDRLFRPEDVKNIKLIYHLLRERKYTMEGAKDFLKQSKKADEKFVMIESLKKLKGFLNELKAGL